MAWAPLAWAAAMSASMARYESRGSAGPIRRTSSATRVCRAPRSACEHTATLRTPIARSVRAMRHAISPRLAIRTLENMRARPWETGPWEPRAGARVGCAIRSGGTLRFRFARHPRGLSPLEERAEPFLGLLAGAHFGQHARHRRAVLLPARIGPQLEQGLDARLGAR